MQSQYDSDRLKHAAIKGKAIGRILNGMDENDTDLEKFIPKWYLDMKKALKTEKTKQH